MFAAGKTQLRRSARALDPNPGGSVRDCGGVLRQPKMERQGHPNCLTCGYTEDVKNRGSDHSLPERKIDDGHHSNFLLVL
jgi:hypothetical protein